MRMRIESILRSVLVSDPGFVGIAGSRIYKMRLPREPEFPAVTYQMISRVQDDITGIITARIQYTCIGETWSNADDLADAIRYTLHGYRAHRDGKHITYTQYLAQHDESDDVTGIYSIPVDIAVTYRED